MKNNYVPFLKLKDSEVGALKVLDLAILKRITPFFDIPKEKKEAPAKLEAKILRAAKSTSTHLDSLSEFYLDNLDVSSDILINGRDSYYHVIEAFKDTRFIPVIGIDRRREHNQAVFIGKRNSLIKSSGVALRIQPEDFEDYDLVSADIEALFDEGKNLFTEWDLVLDNRLCAGIDTDERADQLIKFIKEALNFYHLRKVIVTGSSIPASIAEVLKTDSTVEHRRTELQIYSKIAAEIKHPSLHLGDYTIVSPYYSEVNIPGESMRNVMAPRIIYTYAGVHHITRGIPLAKHEAGNRQYDEMAAILVARPFFRHATYSFGEVYLIEKSLSIGKQVTPSSILKPTISTHITYMSLDYPI